MNETLIASELQNICVYCGSGSGRNPAFADAARELGRLLAPQRVGLVYGGGSLGLMGEIARSVLDHGGHVTGIIPGFLSEREHMLMAAQERKGSLLARLIRREEIEETDRAMGLLEYLGIAAVKDNLASNLSYGQQKLLDFGMALMPEPEVVLLDEPLAGVNPTMINTLVGHIRDLNARGHTFVVIEHNMEVVMSLCRRIVVLSQGERIAEGTPQEVADNPLVLDAYFGR